MKVTTTFTGWLINGKPVAPSQISYGYTFKAHEGAEVKRILGARKLTPQFNRSR